MRKFFPLFIILALMTGCSSSDSGTDGPEQTDPVINLSMYNIDIPTNKETVRTVTVESSEGWTAAVPQEHAAWLSVSPSSASSAGSATVSVSVTENTGYDKRKGTVTFSLTDGTAKTLTVTQSQTNILEADEDPISVSRDGGQIEIPVRYNTGDYKISINPPEGSAEEEITWMRPAATRAVTEETILFDVDANDGIMVRTALIVISDADTGLSATVTVEQEEAEAIFSVSEPVFAFDNTGGEVVFTVTTNIPFYEIGIEYGSYDGWVTEVSSPDGTNGEYVYSVSPNYSTAERTADIYFSSDAADIDATVAISQTGASIVWSDRDYTKLQEATVGNGVNVVIMGDGYTEDEINGSGKYEAVMREAMEDFFSVYPYSAYRDYFTVWMMVGISNESGTSIGNNTKDTRFSAKLAGGGSTAISCNYDLVSSFATSIPGLTDRDKLTAIVIINSTEYAGTCLMHATGWSISMCPRSNNPTPNYNARALVMHEAGGHGFAKLCDEYRYYSQSIPSSDIEAIRSWQRYSRSQMNVDFTDDLDRILWKDFLQYDKYTTSSFSPVGAYEGNSYYYYGAWRSESNSCMNNNVDYFNAPSRWEIVRRIMDLSGESSKYASEAAMFEWFVENDNPPQPTYSRSAADPQYFIPLGRPVLVE